MRALSCRRRKSKDERLDACRQIIRGARMHFNFNFDFTFMWIIALKRGRRIRIVGDDFAPMMFPSRVAALFELKKRKLLRNYEYAIIKRVKNGNA